MTSTEASSDAAMLTSPGPAAQASDASNGSTTNNNNNNTSMKTPPRNNYHNPHTPIASIKRPRSSLQKAAAAAASSSRSSSHMTPVRSNGVTPNNNETALSPMHPVRPVHRSAKDAVVTVVEEPPLQQQVQPAAPAKKSEDEGVLSNTSCGATMMMDHDEDEDGGHLADGGCSSSKEESSSTAAWVGRKVDALFSPVLRFLDQQQDGEDDDDGEPSDLAATTSSNTSSPESLVVLMDQDSGTTENDPHNTSTATTDDCASTHSDASSLQGQGMPEHDSDDFNPWQFIQSLPPYEHVQHLCPPVALPPKSPTAPPITLVLDLDETLVHCSVEAVPDADLEFPVQFNGCTYQVHVKLRPYLFEFLQACSTQFEVVLFTASQKIYANELLNRIDPEGKFIQHRLFRESCLAVEGNFLKDLNVLGRDLTKTILVDNSPHAFGYQVDNGVPIESWFDDPADKELLKLERFLRSHCTMANTATAAGNDVRTVLRNKFGCQKLVDEAPPLPFLLPHSASEEEHEQQQQQDDNNAGGKVSC